MFSTATMPAAECAPLLFCPPEGELSNMIEQHSRHQQSGQAGKQSRENKEQDDQLPGVKQLRHDESGDSQPYALEKFPAWYGVVHSAASIFDQGERFIGMVDTMASARTWSLSVSPPNDLRVA